MGVRPAGEAGHHRGALSLSQALVGDAGPALAGGARGLLRLGLPAGDHLQRGPRARGRAGAPWPAGQTASATATGEDQRGATGQGRRLLDGRQGAA
eukprot:15452936-Alexandrium_andersonii.AAC.1